MAKVNKIDFYCGAFLSYIISNGAEPTLFDASEKSKFIKFALRDKDYNVYLKYVGSSNETIKGGKTYYKWDILFTSAEKEILKNGFEETGKENIVVLVCANDNFKDTYFAIISLEDALKCLGDDNVNNQWRISIKRLKGSKYVDCYGTAISDTNAIRLKYDFDTYFDF